MVFGKIRISTVLTLLGLFFLYFATRLTHIMSLPIFTDETIYVRWAQIAKQDAAWRFISLTDGKQPSFIWLAINSMRIFHDPLLATRLVSVGAGFIALVGIMLLALELFKKKQTGGILHQIFGHLKASKRIGYLSGLLFVLFPFALVYDRMALYDSLLAATMVWSLYAEVLLVRYVRLDLGFITGIIIGSSMLTKTSGFFGIYLLPFSLLLFDFKQKQATKKFLEWVLYSGVTILVSYSMYSILRLSPFYYIINEKNALFIYPFSEWIKHPLDYVKGNFNALIPWFVVYTTIPIIMLATVAFGLKGKLREKLLLLVWFIMPFVLLGVFGKTLYPRFIYFMTLPVLVLVAYTLEYLFERFKNKLYPILLLVLSVLFFIYADYFIVFDFPNAPIAKPDLGQYINSWPAGGGIKEMVFFFNQQAKNGKIYVVTQGTFGSLPTYSMEIYLGNNKNIEKRGMYPLPSTIPSDLVERARTMPVYIVFNDSENAPVAWPVTLIAKYQKGIGDRHLSIYQVNP